MRSSGSTRNPRPDAELRLLLVLAGEDHPKACTGRRLLKWRRVVRVPREDAHVPRPIVLDPYAPTPLSPSDRPIARRGGLLAVDCSWNRLQARGAFPGSEPGGRTPPNHRRLPLLIATNPHHYGRVAQLNTVEALSAALYVLGQPREAERLMEGFRGGDEFLRVNRARLELYRAAPSSREVSAAERTLFGGE